RSPQVEEAGTVEGAQMLRLQLAAGTNGGVVPPLESRVGAAAPELPVPRAAPPRCATTRADHGVELTQPLRDLRQPLGGHSIRGRGRMHLLTGADDRVQALLDGQQLLAQLVG